MNRAETILELKNISKSFGGIAVIQDVSLRVGRREILGLIGPNGAGKTTLINIITASLPKDKGTILFKEKPVNKSRPDLMAMEGMSRTFQQSKVFADFTIIENVMLPMLIKNVKRSEAFARSTKILESVGIGGSTYYKKPTTLNQSDRKMLEFARAIAGDPDIILLDEVMAGMSSVESERVVKLVTELCSEGTSFIVVEHIMHIIRNLCHRVAVLSAGKLIKEGPAHIVMDDPEVVRAYLGEINDAKGQ